MKKQTKEFAFARGEESIKSVGIFPDDQMGEKADFFAGLGEMIEGRDRNENLVSDPLAIHDGVGRPSFGEATFEKCNHFRRLPESCGWKRLYDAGE
jgi:hypothetical protein